MMRALVTLALVTLTPLARAQQSPPTQDEIPRLDLVRQAQEARAVGDHLRALELASRAFQLRPTPSLQLFIAQAEDHLGRVVDAYGNALACERSAQVDPTLRNREVIQTTCRALVDSLRGRVGNLRVSVVGGVTPFTLRVGGHEVAATVRDLPRVVAPGSVEVAIDAPGHLPWRRTVEVAAGATVDVPVVLVRADTPAASVAPPSVGVGPYLLAGVGAASLATAAVLYGFSLGARDERDAGCTPLGCHPLSIEHNARYTDLTLGTNVALGVGGALVAGGVVWWVVVRLRGRSSRTEAPHLTPVVTAQGAGLTLGGTL